jgi:membrane protein
MNTGVPPSGTFVSGDMKTSGDAVEDRIRLHWHDVGRLLKETGDAWVNDNVPRLSASLAFYTVLSLIPFLIVVTAVAAGLLGQKAAQGQLTREIRDLIGRAGAEAIQALIESASKSSTAATVLGSVTLAFSASAVVMELREALNTIWNVPVTAGASSLENFLRLVKERFYLFGLILGAGIMLIASLALNALVVAAADSLGARPLLHLAVFFGSFVVITIMFAAVYKVVPDVPLAWRDVIVGACATSLVFTIGKVLIALYLGRASFGSTYGAAGSILILLVWVYYSAQLFFFGAEFTKIYARKTRRQPLPSGAATSLSQSTQRR